MSHSTIIKGVRRTVLAALGITVLGIGSAWAVPVTTWSFNITTTFDTGNTVFTDGPGHNAGTTTNTSTELAWGNATPQSSLVISPSNTPAGSVDTDGAIVDSGNIMTHNNYVIPSNSHILQSGVLLNSVILTAAVPPGPADGPFALDFAFSFDETPNRKPCADTSSPTPCNDIFVISHDSLNQPFTYNGDNYFLSLFPLTNGGVISKLTNAECADAGAAPGCFGFTTEENSSNPLHFGLTITTARIGVPEPGTLGMVGLGLLAIVGLAIRRRKPSVQ